MTFLLLAVLAQFPFEMKQPGEVVAEVEMHAPGADWGVRGREAAVAVMRVDQRSEHHAMVHAARLTYRVFLGRLDAGSHVLTVDRDAAQSAAGAKLEVTAARFRTVTAQDPDYLPLAHAPVLYARRNTVGRFSDAPLLSYCQRLPDNVLQYTVVFSNEDGGTSTRALMARWGRTTDIEYVARVFLKPDGSADRTIIQGPSHRDLLFEGDHEDQHAVLMPITNNNMVGPGLGSALRFQLAPVVIDLERASREQVMDELPVTYEIMAKELAREDKLRPFGTTSGEKISDPRNYAYFEYKSSFVDAAMTVSVTLKDGRGFASDLGRNDLAIGRNEWVRTTVELPPGTRASDIAGVTFACVVPPPEKNKTFAHSGKCSLEAVSKAFFLGRDYRPGASWLSLSKPVELRTGTSVTVRP